MPRKKRLLRLEDFPVRVRQIIVEETEASGLRLTQVLMMSAEREPAYVRYRIWTRQRQTVQGITGEPCSYPYIALMWGVDHSTVMRGVALTEGRPWPAHKAAA